MDRTFPVSTKTEVSSTQSPSSPAREAFPVVLPQPCSSGKSVAAAVRVQPITSRNLSRTWSLGRDGAMDAASSGADHQPAQRGRSPTVMPDLMYLGRAAVEQPTSQRECEEGMAQLVSAEALSVDLVFPCDASRALHIVDRQSGEDLASFPVRIVVSCVRSVMAAAEATTPVVAYVGLCVAERQQAAVAASGDSRPSAGTPGGTLVYYCHVLQVDDMRRVSLIIDAMDTVFWRQSLEYPFHKLGTNDTSDSLAAPCLRIEVAFDVREPSADGRLVSVPRSCRGGVFELQRGVEKQIMVLVVQSANAKPLEPRRCVGVAIAAGSKVGQSAMNLVEPGKLEKIGKTWRSFLVRASWKPCDERDIQLNEITKPGYAVCMSIAADIEFVEVADPLRFMREINVRVRERHDCLVHSIAMSPLFDLHSVTFRSQPAHTPDEEPKTLDGTPPFLLEVEKIDLFINHRAGSSTPRRGGNRLTLTANTRATARAQEAPNTLSVGNNDRVNDTAKPRSFSPALHRLFGARRPVSGNSSSERTSDANDSAGPAIPGDEEILLSGGGVADREWTYIERKEWGHIINSLDSGYEAANNSPKDLKELVRKGGVPEDLRGIVWPVLCGCRGENDNAFFQCMVEEECGDEKVIRNDLHRTFTGHQFFSVPGAPGQEALYAVCKAYSNFDSDVGYCQGLSYIIATLVLHMSTECAFRVFVCIMASYGLRDLFAVGLSGLKFRLFQLARLVEDQIPDLHNHFLRQEVNVAMFATQWFLSLYASSFGLYATSRFLDAFLNNGLETILQMAIALLKMNRKNLLQLEFDGILDYFRHLPKKYLTPASVGNLMEMLHSTKIPMRKLMRYSKEYDMKTLVESFEQQQIDKLQSQVYKLQDDNQQLTKRNKTLLQESEDLVRSKIQMRLDMDMLEHRMGRLAKQHRLLQADHEAMRDKLAYTLESQKMGIQRRMSSSVDSVPLSISEDTNDTTTSGITGRDSPV